MKILALKGNNGIGKDTVAKLIAKKLDNVEILSFAEPLKRIFNSLYGEVDWDDRQTKEIQRPKLEKLANAIKAGLGEYIFTSRLDSILHDCYLENKFPIITDLRFQEEYKYLVKYCLKDDELFIAEINDGNASNQYDLKSIPSDFVINTTKDLDWQIEELMSKINEK